MSTGRGVFAVVAAVLLSVSVQVAPVSPAIQPARADTQRPKAVFIVGPTNRLTDSNIVDASRMADQAAAEGMDVRRVFFPYATWDNVLANVQGANLVVYMGHGYGWPSPYTSRLTESRQNGFGLNSFAGSGRSEYTYYGAAPIRQHIRLAPNAIVILVHGCYTAGNGEPGMAIPSEDLARQRVDNYASGFLAAGARAVFAFGWDQKLNYPRALASSEATMDQLFTSPATGSPAGFVGWRDRLLASQRIPGASIHLDPHPSYGYYRSLTGDPGMTAAEWRAGATESGPPPPLEGTADPPQITQLKVTGVEAVGGAEADLTPSFHPNGDGLDDVLLVDHTVTRSAYIDVTVSNEAGMTVRSFWVWAAGGSGTSRWDGHSDAGRVVPDGQYTLKYVPRDVYGVTGSAVSVRVLVLTAISLGRLTRSAIHVSDADQTARATSLEVRLNQPARISWRILDGTGATVRTVRSETSAPAGTIGFTWDGRDDAGRWVADGPYWTVVRAQTGLGAYSQEREMFVGAFRVIPSNNSPARGDRITLTLLSTETLDRNPSVSVAQSGLEPWTVGATQQSGRKYQATFTLKNDGTAGTVDFLVSGTDSGGQAQSSAVSLPLR